MSIPLKATASVQFPDGAILKEYQQKIFRLALSIARNQKDAEDILQNTLLKIFRKLPLFKNRSRLSTWIYRVAYNEALMYLRKRRRLYRSADAYRDYAGRLPVGLTVNWGRLPDQQLLDKELREHIDAALRDIPLSYRMPLLLHRIEGFSLAESARILGIQESTVKTRLHRAYCMVRDRMRDYAKDIPHQRTAEDKRCGTWTGFLFDYVRGTPGSARSRSFRRHIKDCPRCTSFLRDYRQAIRITGSLDCRDVPVQLKERVSAFLAA